MMHAEQLPLELGAKYAGRLPCEGHRHLQEVSIFSLCALAIITCAGILQAIIVSLKEIFVAKHNILCSHIVL
jgi:hypothetical protein